MASPLFVTETAKCRSLYKLYAASMLVGMCLILFYRATNIPESGEDGRWAWMGLFGAELWFSFYWIITQSVRWNPVYRRTFKERLAQRWGAELPGIDIFVCTADPIAEPPSLVISTVLSLLAYDYPPHKMSVYVSDDGGSELTFYALWEATQFAKHWLPFCRKFKVEPRSPAAYFSRSRGPHDSSDPKDYSSIKELFDGMTNRIDSAATLGKVTEKHRQHKGFSEWNSTTTKRNHQPIVQILINGRDKDAVDMDGNRLPTLVYMAREKRPQHHHNFKAGAMNSLVELRGLDSWGGPLYIGTGCFHRREILCGKKYSKDHKEDWKAATMRNVDQESPCTLEDRAKALATCTFEQNTQWGKEIGLKYGCPVEDVFTGLFIHCRGWKSVYFNPARKGFLGIAPATLSQTLVQHKRWAEGNFSIFASKYCSFLIGHGKITLGLQMGYNIYGLWAANSIPFLYYLAIPSLCLVKGISLFPKVSSLWCLPFAYVTLAKQAYSLIEALWYGDTMIGWWNTQRMWVFKRLTSYLYGIIDTIFSLMGLCQMAFVITEKVTDGEVSKRYEKEVMEFGASSSMFTIIGTYALLNLVCFMVGVKRLVVGEPNDGFDPLSLQLLLCGAVVLLNAPVYNGLFLRKDKGSMPTIVMLASIGFSSLACLLPII